MNKHTGPAAVVHADSPLCVPLICPDPSYNASLPWFALQVRTQAERYTTDILTRKGYECFMPTLPADNPRLVRRNKHDLPLFPGYVFCRFDLLKRLPILMTPGVLGVVGIGRVPIPLDDAEIFSIREAIRRRFRVRPWPDVQFGSSVKIIDGPMAGLTGSLASVKNQHRLIVTLSLLQRSVLVEVDRDCLQLS